MQNKDRSFGVKINGSLHMKALVQQKKKEKFAQQCREEQDMRL